MGWPQKATIKALFERRGVCKIRQVKFGCLSLDRAEKYRNKQRAEMKDKQKVGVVSQVKFKQARTTKLGFTWGHNLAKQQIFLKQDPEKE